jgi:hypothetical protein
MIVHVGQFFNKNITMHSDCALHKPTHICTWQVAGLPDYFQSNKPKSPKKQTKWQKNEKQTKFLMKRNQKQTILSPMNKTIKQVIFSYITTQMGFKNYLMFII